MSSEIDPDIGRRLEAAQGYAELGMVEDAWSELTPLLDGHGFHSGVLQTQLYLLVRERRWEDGLNCSRRLQRVDPEAPSSYIHGAYCLHELGRTLEAREYLSEGPAGIREEPVYHYNLACYEAALGEMEVARDALLRALEMDSGLESQARSDPDLSLLWDAIEGA